MLLLYWCVTLEEILIDCDDGEYYQWAKEDRKVKKVVQSVDVEEAIELFNEQVKNLKAHIFVKRTQNTHYKWLKENHELIHNSFRLQQKLQK